MQFEWFIKLKLLNKMPDKLRWLVMAPISHLLDGYKYLSGIQIWNWKLICDIMTIFNQSTEVHVLTGAKVLENTTDTPLRTPPLSIDPQDVLFFSIKLSFYDIFLFWFIHSLHKFTKTNICKNQTLYVLYTPVYRGSDYF